MTVICDISVSLDGFVAGPNQTLEQPLGEGGEDLHEWVVRLKSWRERHGMEGGETGPDEEVIQESVERAGATIMGRRMFSSGSGPMPSCIGSGGRLSGRFCCSDSCSPSRRSCMSGPTSTIPAGAS